jgi:hypothetical protein
MRLLTVVKSSYDPFSELGVFRRREESVAPDYVTGKLTPE